MWQNLLKSIIAVALISWLVHSGRLDFKSLVVLANSKYLIICFVTVAISLIIASERWRILLKAQNISMNFYETLKLTFIGSFFSFAMPGGVGGDIIKGYYIARKQHTAKTESVVSVLMDRLTGLYAMILMAILAMVIFGHGSFQRWELKISLILLLCLFAGFTIAWVLMLSEKIQNHRWMQKLSQIPKLAKIYQACTGYRHKKSLFFQAIGLSFVSQTFSVLFFIFAGYGLGGFNIPLNIYFFVVPLGFMLTALPISVAGIGVGQAAFLFLFQVSLTAGSNIQIGPDMMTAYQVTLFALSLMGAYFYMTMKKSI